jgi:hypothetical protein
MWARGVLQIPSRVMRGLGLAGFVLVVAASSSALLACNSIVGVEEVTLKKDSQTKKGGTTSGSSGGDDESSSGNTSGDGTNRPTGTPSTPDDNDEKPGDKTTPTTKTECNGTLACERIAFVTRAKFTGNLGGLAGADQKCVDAAKSIPGLGGRAFRAWLSDSLSSAKDRLPKGTQNYRRTDKTIVATNFVDLLDGTVALPIALDEKSTMLDTDSLERTVWTGTSKTGEKDEFTCRDWTSGDIMQTGNYGDSQSTDLTWTSSGTSSCNAPRHLYCLEY